MVMDKLLELWRWCVQAFLYINICILGKETTGLAGWYQFLM